jgi:signal recognition particle receptor subunit beta
MVFFNYATMQMAAKIVYYGPGLCGKTTNLHHIYAKTSPQSRGEMVSLETETDRTLFFDLLPIDVGVIGGFKTRLQLYTIPGQVFYNTTRKLVLKGVDGIVFVADSQKAMLDANLESFKNLRENLAEIGVSVDEIPLVMQLNKRDLPNIADIDTMLGVLDPDRKYEHVEAIAAGGTGVFETLKTISKLTLRQLRRRMTGDEPAKAAPKREVGTFRVQGESPAPAPRTTVNQTAPIPAFTGTASAPAPPPTAPPPRSGPTFVAPAAAAQARRTVEEPVEELVASEMIPEPEPQPLPAPPSFADVPVAEPPASHPPEPEAAPFPEPPTDTMPPVSEPVLEAAPEPAPISVPEDHHEPEIDFGQTEKPAGAAAEVKHVKVRSSVDVMAELEALRKKATQTTPKPSKRDPIAELLAATKPKRDVHKTLTMAIAPEVLPKTRRIRVAVSFESDDGVLQTQDQVIELAADTSEVGSYSVNLKLES